MSHSTLDEPCGCIAMQPLSNAAMSRDQEMRQHGGFPTCALLKSLKNTLKNE